jgi:hypothetical protein
MRASGGLRKWLAPRLTDDSGAALLIALFLIAAVAALSVAIGGIVLSQVAGAPADG